jgi:hypothetical protein
MKTECTPAQLEFHCRDAIMSWCEAQEVGYVLGLARNPRLHRALGREMAEVQVEHEQTGRPARRFRDFRYRTRKSWSCERRVIGKAEYYVKFGFRHVPELVYEGVPPEYFFALPFGGARY